MLNRDRVNILINGVDALQISGYHSDMGGFGGIIDQDTALGVQMTLTQAELAEYRERARLGEYAVVFRTQRSLQGGGYGDQEKHPFAWGVIVYVDGMAARLYSARGHAREWASFERLEKWLRAQGFWYWWMRNDLEPLYEGDDAVAEAAELDD